MLGALITLMAFVPPAMAQTAPHLSPLLQNCGEPTTAPCAPFDAAQRASAPPGAGVVLVQGQAKPGIAPTIKAPPASSPAPPVILPNPLDTAGGRPTHAYVGELMLRAPIGPLPGGDALLAYTRELLAPSFPGLTLRPMSASNAAAFSGSAPGLPSLTMRWWDQAGAGAASIQRAIFQRDLNGGCTDDGIFAQRGGAGARVIFYTSTCPTVNPPYQLLWLEAFDNERSRLFLLATPSANGAALLAGGERLLAAFGMSRVASAASPSAAPTRPPAQASTLARGAQTTRGLLADKPFAVSYPAGLTRRDDGNSDLTLTGAGQELEFTLTIRPATPSLSAEFDARAFGSGTTYLQMLRRSVPGAALIGNSLLRLPAGPAHLIHWSAPASGSAPAFRYIDVTLYGAGREYRLSFAVQERALEQRREVIAFILANFAMSNAPIQCCAEPVALP